MGTLFTSFLLPLAAGFIVLSRLPYLSHVAGRADGYRLMLMSVSTGIALVFLGHLVLVPAGHVVGLLDRYGLENLAHLLRMTWRLVGRFTGDSALGLPGPLSDAVTMMLLLVPVVLLLAPLYSRAIGIRGRLELDGRARFRYGGAYENFFTEAMLHGEPVLVTLKSRKIYVGLVTQVPQSVPGRAGDITLLPSFSGYRSVNRLTLNVTRDYRLFLEAIQRWYDPPPGPPVSVGQDTGGGPLLTVDYDTVGFMADHFGVVLPLSEIESVSIWIPQIHELSGDGGTEIALPD